MEFELIESIRRRVSGRPDVVLGIGDDAALLRVPEGHELVLCVDTLNLGVHFPQETEPFDLGWKALAVNLSDLAAMAAQPAWCTLSLSLPAADAAWIEGFLDGFFQLASAHAVALVGGDTTRGPLSISVSAQGFVPHTCALRRVGARQGDDLWVTGTLGDAAAALSQWRAGASMAAALRERLDRPTPRVAAGIALRGIARACIDISDGLLADLAHLLDASGGGACVELAALPTSSALIQAFDITTRYALQLHGGDDYELCFSAAPSRRAEIAATLAACDTPATRIGWVESQPGLRIIRSDGSVQSAAPQGWDHFSGSGA